MPSSDCPALVAQQREYFLAGHTRPAAWRKSQLEAVKALLPAIFHPQPNPLSRELIRYRTKVEGVSYEYPRLHKKKMIRAAYTRLWEFRTCTRRSRRIPEWKV
jgi:hypothetical protein